MLGVQMDGLMAQHWRRKATGDYHDEMTSKHYEEWFHDSLIPNIPVNLLIVIDIFSYHSRRLKPVPTMSSQKQVVQDWLTANGMENVGQEQWKKLLENVQ